MLTVWPVTLRLQQKGFHIPSDLRVWAMKCYIAYKGPGVFTKNRKGIFFLGIEDPEFMYCYGWLPHQLPEGDEFQPVPAGDTSWFIEHLKKKGFQEVEP
jgi:hypothetical protein